jgi:hypothetical protein
MMGLLVGSAVIVAAVVVIVQVMSSRGARRTSASARRLFRSLCRAHRLNWWDRRLLCRLARACRLPDAGRLFIDPRYFDAETARGRPRANASRIAELRQQLFGG